MLTKGALTFKWPIRDTYGSGVVQLLSTGAPMRAQLSRTDWHAFPEDRFGVCIARSQVRKLNTDPMLEDAARCFEFWIAASWESS